MSELNSTFDHLREGKEALLATRIETFLTEGYADQPESVSIQNEWWAERVGTLVEAYKGLHPHADELSAELITASDELRGQAARIVDEWTHEEIHYAHGRWQSGLANGYRDFEGSMEDAEDRMAVQTEKLLAGRTSGSPFLQAFLDEVDDPALLSLLEAQQEGELTTFEDLPGGKEGIERFTLKAMQHAQAAAKAGVVPYYISALKEPAYEGFQDEVAVCVVDPDGKDIQAGKGMERKFSAQSTIKPLLFLYALWKGERRTAIAGYEPTANPFNYDLTLDYTKDAETAEHGAINAGAISAAGAIDDFNDFLEFMRILTGNENLAVNEDIYKAETRDAGGNRALANSLHKRPRFSSYLEAEKAVNAYHRACSIEVTALDLARAYSVIASGGQKNGKQIVPRDMTVPVIASIGSFGLYDGHWEITEMICGGTMLSAKTGVGGAFVNVMPGGLVVVTWAPHLDPQGNSVFGTLFNVLTNRAYANNGGMLRSSPGETDERVDAYMEKCVAYAIAELDAGTDPRLVRLPESASIAAGKADIVRALKRTELAGEDVTALIAALGDEHKAALLAALQS